MLKLPYQTLRDPSLPHQVVLFMIECRVHVSCNCQLKDTNSDSHESIGQVDGSIRRARELYNDPKNHRVPFLKEDEAKW